MAAYCTGTQCRPTATACLASSHVGLLGRYLNIEIKCRKYVGKPQWASAMARASGFKHGNNIRELLRPFLLTVL